VVPGASAEGGLRCLASGLRRPGVAASEGAAGHNIPALGVIRPRPIAEAPRSASARQAGDSGSWRFGAADHRPTGDDGTSADEGPLDILRSLEVLQ
jgi:hypothetical protein